VREREEKTKISFYFVIEEVLKITVLKIILLLNEKISRKILYLLI